MRSTKSAIMLASVCMALGAVGLPVRRSSPIAPRLIANVAAPSPQADRVALVPTPSGHGYWIADADGAVSTFGDAPGRGDLRGQRLTQPIVAMASPSGAGYWLADAAGAV